MDEDGNGLVRLPWLMIQSEKVLCRLFVWRKLLVI